MSQIKESILILDHAYYYIIQISLTELKYTYNIAVGLMVTR